MSAATVASSGDDRSCPSYSDGRVLGFDHLHTRCEVCLGAQHAGLALTLRSSCPYCALLPPAEKQQRVDFFTTAVDDVLPLRETYTVEEALEVLDPPDVSDSDESSMPVFLSLPSSSRKSWSTQREDVPSLPATALPSISGLVKELPDIIRHAAARRDLPVPPAQKAPPSDETFSPSLSPAGEMLYGPASRPSGSTKRADQYIARLADRIHQCAFQASAATNNTVLLVSSILKIAADPLMHPELATELTLCACSAVCMARQAAWATMQRCRLWLDQTHIPEASRRELRLGYGWAKPPSEPPKKQSQGRVQEERLSMVLIAPERTSASWFPCLRRLLSGRPWELPRRGDGLSQAGGAGYVPGR
ncbi:uncharacterized protein LOC117472613 [Scomber scombrus]|uniref:Uncharacterized protein LOC117472613 n=1 Tax=Scomber scombrus TaxID=13677 RepID=A0AAV1PUL8_SCOSC